VSDVLNIVAKLQKASGDFAQTGFRAAKVWTGRMTELAEEEIRCKDQFVYREFSDPLDAARS
jgi:hypothetical protein